MKEIRKAEWRDVGGEREGGRREDETKEGGMGKKRRGIISEGTEERGKGKGSKRE